MQQKLADIFFDENNFIQVKEYKWIKFLKPFPDLNIGSFVIGFCKKNDISSIKLFDEAIELNRDNFIVNNPKYLSIKTNLHEFHDSFNRDYFETLAKQSKKYFIIIYPDKKVSFLLIFEMEDKYFIVPNLENQEEQEL